MKNRVNMYVATLLVTLAGSGAAMLILNVALDNNFTRLQQENESMYLELKQSILNSRAN